jgi:hypothetical protein
MARGNPVGGQEIPDTERVQRVPGADHAQAGEASRFAQELPPGDERLQDDVAQVRALVQHLAQSVGGDLVDLAIASRNGADQRLLAGQVVHVAGELPLTVEGDPPRSVPRLVQDLDASGLHDEELEILVADLDQDVPVGIALERRGGALARAAICVSSRTGKATECRSGPAMLPSPGKPTVSRNAISRLRGRHAPRENPSEHEISLDDTHRA